MDLLPEARISHFKHIFEYLLLRFFLVNVTVETSEGILHNRSHKFSRFFRLALDTKAFTISDDFSAFRIDFDKAIRNKEGEKLGYKSNSSDLVREIY